MPRVVSSKCPLILDPWVCAIPVYHCGMTGRYFWRISWSSAFHSLGCSVVGAFIASLILASMAGSEKASKLVPRPTFLMSVDWKFGGIHVEPDGQSEHQPAERRLMSLFGLSRSAVYCASGGATGVALRPAAWPARSRIVSLL